MMSQGASHRIGFGVLFLCILAFLVIPLRGFHGTVLHGVDFKTVYSSSKCLIDRCNPYDSSVLLQEYTKAGGDISPDSDLSAFKPYQALYPPSSLFWVVPFALLPWAQALALWMAVSGILFVIAALLMADLCRQWSSSIPLILLGLFVATSTLLISTAQPSAVSISLCAIGVWSLIKKRMPALGIACFALSLALKPQIGGLIVVYFLIAHGPARKKAIVILALAAILCVPGIVWAASIPAAAHWPQLMSANIAGSAVPGSINDPGPSSYNALLVTDLQSVFAVFDDVPRVYNLEARLVVGALMLVWAYIAFRARPSLKRDVLGVATMACLCLLPIYHRHYDVRLLVLTFPALALLLEEGGWEGPLALIASVLVLCGSHPTFIRDHLALHQETLGPFKTILFLRTSPLTLLFSAIVYLVCFATTLKATNTVETATVNRS